MGLKWGLFGDYDSPKTKAVADRLDELKIPYTKVGPDGDNPGDVTLGTPGGRFQGINRIFQLLGKPKSLEQVD